jgi:hypothetical protein
VPDEADVVRRQRQQRRAFYPWALVNRPDTTSTAWVVNGDADQTLTTAATVNT